MWKGGKRMKTIKELIDEKKGADNIQSFVLGKQIARLLEVLELIEEIKGGQRTISGNKWIDSDELISRIEG